MKNQLIATIVAGVILFVWQFISWAAVNFHKSEQMYTPNQDAIIQMLSENLEPGTYYIPQAAPGEDQMAALEKYGGKPWAVVSYHASMPTEMGMNLFRGFVVDLLAAFLLVWILMNFSNLTFKTAMLGSLAVGAVAYLTIPYMNSIWFENDSTGYIIDLIGQWGLVGAWLGFYLTRK